MQKFALLHDGSDQGWQAAYLALHVAARLGAPLHVLHIGGGTDSETTAQRIAQVEISGNAAGVQMKTGLLAGLSIDALSKTVTSVDGVFLPQHFISDGEFVDRVQEVYSCPLWIASQEPEIRMMAVLIEGPQDARLIEFARSLSNRLGQSLTGILPEDPKVEEFVHGLPDTLRLTQSMISPGSMSAVLKQIQAGLLILPASRISLAGNLSCNCILYSGPPGA